MYFDEIILNFFKFIDKKEQPNYQGYKRNIYQRKYGVNESMKMLKNDFEVAGVDLHFVVSLCLHNDAL